MSNLACRFTIYTQSFQLLFMTTKRIWVVNLIHAWCAVLTAGTAEVPADMKEQRPCLLVGYQDLRAEHSLEWENLLARQ